MAYSDLALAFSTIAPNEQIRLEDRISFAYLDCVVVQQEETGVVASQKLEDDTVQRWRIQLPVSGLAVLILGPGTSISAPALTSCARAGCTVLFTGGEGLPLYTYAAPLTSSSRWAQAQATLVASETYQQQAAIKLYERQLGLSLSAAPTIRAMRGIEGQTIKQLYSKLSRKYHVKGFRRNVESQDPINMHLNIANSILYGCAASVIHALGLNPALGIIHRGDMRSFIFDLADIYKPTISIPLSFQFAHENRGADELRRALRSEIHHKALLNELICLVMELLQPYLPLSEGDRLVDDDGLSVPGHTLYSL